jgi:GDP-D-mannose 3', 5'-epimerase
VRVVPVRDVTPPSPGSATGAPNRIGCAAASGAAKIDRRSDTLVAGAGGFIGGHLVATLLDRGHEVRAVDVKPLDQWHQAFPEAQNRTLDLSLIEDCRAAVEGVQHVYNLAADMGGIGFIEGNKAPCMLSVLIGSHMLVAANEAGVDRFFYSSSACVYPAGKQNDAAVTPLAEDDAYPAMPEDGYGWEKLFSERMCRHFLEDFGLQTRVARYHNVYGPEGTYRGGREKAPAAICRKVAQAVLTDSPAIEIWGDGQQTRSFMYVDDCVDGTIMIAEGEPAEPINLGSSELVTINQLVDIVEDIAGVALERTYLTDAPQGVRGRNSDNDLINELYGWEPSISLREGLERTYRWIHEQVAADLTAARV